MDCGVENIQTFPPLGPVSGHVRAVTMVWILT